MENQPNPFANPAYQQRLQFYKDTVECKKTDRVLCAPFLGQLPMHLYPEAGVTMKDAMDDYNKAVPLFLRYVKEYDPDLAPGISWWPSAPLNLLGCRFIRWPGKQIADPMASFQVLNEEWMKQEEYQDYIDDPTGFMLTKILPRQWEALGGLGMLDFANPLWQGAAYGMIPFALPPVKAALDAMGKTGEAMMACAKANMDLAFACAAEGYPNQLDYAACIPFDFFNDMLRGFLNTTTDMIEVPDMFHKALDVMTRICVRQIKAQLKRQSPFGTCIFFMHNGFDTFMSAAQFEEFYLPSIMAMADAVLECGWIPEFYTEEKYDLKLEILAKNLPPQKCILYLVNSDMKRAKELFEGKVCLAGGVDGPALAFGDEDDVRKSVRKMKDIFGKDGGYILDCTTSIDIAKPENLRALFDEARK
jgi:hypothetical protein